MAASVNILDTFVAHNMSAILNASRFAMTPFI
jgi:hypothetical protein